MNSNMASERSALANHSSSCWSLIFSNPSIRKRRKAFDKVSHEKLAHKLHDYGIRGPALKWVKGFLITATSLSLLFILPSQHLPNQRFPRKILIDMEFNPSKYQVIHITRSTNPIPTQYTLHNCILESVFSAKYLRVDISSDLSLDTHINRISKKANTTLGFLRRNIKIHSESLKSSICLHSS